MSHDLWRRVNALFEKVVDLPPDERLSRLDRWCGEDSQLRDAVERRLEADAEAEDADFLRPLLVAPTLPREVNEDSARSLKEEIGGEPGSPAERLGPYRLLEEIGRGGMGTVYAARRDDDAFDRRVAVKLISAGTESEEIVRRMKSERRILARLEHPNIARIYDAGATEAGLPYFVMELVEGEPIDSFCHRRALSVTHRVALIRRVCSAVAYANRNLVVHRDLKPSNILVTADGEPKLLDFGIAKLLDTDAGIVDAERSRTAPWHQRLTLNYASPEQIKGRPVSTSSDVYPLGVLLFQLLTGALPRSFDGLTPWEAGERLAKDEPPRPSSAATTERSPSRPPGSRRHLSMQLQGDLDSIVLKALRSDPDARYPSADELGQDLERYLAGFPVKAHQGSFRYRAGKLLRRHRLAATLAAGALLLSCAFLAQVVLSSRQMARSQARLEAEQAEKEQVLGVFLSIFEQAGPYVSQGVPLTLREAVDRYAGRAIHELDGQPMALSSVLSTLGWVYLDLGALDKAEDFHSRALELRREVGAGPAAEAESLDGVAAAMREQWKFDDAEAHSRAALELLEEAPESVDARQRLRTLNNRVTLLCIRQEWAAADEVSEQALGLGRLLGTEEDPQVPIALSQRAQVIKNLGDGEGARILYLEALELTQHRYGSEHPLLAVLYNNLAGLEHEAGRIDAAVDAWRRADAQYAAAFGDDFYDRIIPLTHLGRTLSAEGRFEEAEIPLRQAIGVAVRSPALGPEHEPRFFGRPATLLAKILATSGRCPEMLELLGQKMEAWPESPVRAEAISLVTECRGESRKTPRR